jgi:glycosyltransferase involved in cell wall biosynthesis
MAELPRVTVIATVLNEVETIGNLISSFSQQTLPDFEIVIVDGGSSDGTWERLLQLAAQEPRLRAIRDESCNLRSSPGPIARGRNRAIYEATGSVIACADAGCEYAPDWAERLTAPIAAGDAEYTLGGSYIDPAQATVWDVAAAPFLGIKLRPEGLRKSCTTRSMGMSKNLWKRVGGFPEVNLFGEDTLFDLRARELTIPVFPEGAMARYNPRFTLRSAAEKLGLYATSDGVLGVRRMRLVRNLIRCAAQVAALLALRWTFVPLLIVALLEIFFAFEHDVRGVFNRRFIKVVPARLLFSLMTPWIVAFNHIAGSITKQNRRNPQNSRA